MSELSPKAEAKDMECATPRPSLPPPLCLPVTPVWACTKKRLSRRERARRDIKTLRVSPRQRRGETF